MDDVSQRSAMRCVRRRRCFAFVRSRRSWLSSCLARLLAVAVGADGSCRPTAACRCSPAFRRWRIWWSRSAGEHVKVDVLVQPGQDPHTFEPTPQQVLALGRAAIFFKIDMPFESVLLEKVRKATGG